MKIIGLFLVCLLPVAISVPAAAQKVKLVTSEDSLSYALGVATYSYYAGETLKINTELFSRGMADSQNSKALMADSVANALIMSYMGKKERARLEAENKEQIDASRAFLEANAKAEGVITLPSGLQYKVITPGTGNSPTEWDDVKVNYTGTTTDGTKFDSSSDHGGPATFTLNQVIRGWVEGLQLMKEGGKYIFYIPSDLAYGERGAGNIIKPFETLIFEVELLEVIKRQ